MIDDVCRKGARAYAEALKGEFCFDDERYNSVKKLVEKVATELEDTILWSVRDNMADNLAHTVETCAERAIEAVLKGDEDQFRRWLYADMRGYTGRERAGEVIHGKLFESSAIQLRRELVDAYPEVLKTERIKDLEAQVAALVETNRKQQAEMDRLWERVR